jgi:hypothetical protein
VPDNNNNVLAGPLGFTDEHCFGLFMEGLRALQQYEDEAAGEHPCKDTLARTMGSALSCFRQCVSRYSDDYLPVFYLGVALSMKNQEVYVDRLVELTSELTAFGRMLQFEDEAIALSVIPAQESNENKTLRESKLSFTNDRADEDRAIAQPFRDLGKRPWPLLEEAARLFLTLTDGPVPEELHRVAVYNLAQVWARRGSRDELDFLRGALNVIYRETLPTFAQLTQQVDACELAYQSASQLPGNGLARFSAKKKYLRQKSMAQARQSVRSAYEAIALSIQFDTLRESLNVRLAAFAATDKLLQAITAANTVDDSIKDTNLLDPGFKADLRADYLTRTGYAKYEFASIRELHVAIRVTPDLATALGVPTDGPSARFFLDSAAEDLTIALELKEHWNPAQIYLALVRRIQAGMAEARAIMSRNEQDLVLADDRSAQAEVEDALDDLLGKDQEAIMKAAHKIVENRKKLNEIKARIEKKSQGFKRQIDASEREQKRFAREADALFNALQGVVSTQPATAAASTTAMLAAAKPASPDQPSATAPAKSAAS